MSILNVNQIQPVGSGQTVTISAANITASSATITANTFSGALSSSGISTFSDTVNVGAGKSIRLYGATSGYSDIIAAAGSASTTFTLPANGGTSGQYLQTDGSGGLSWQTVASLSNAEDGTGTDFEFNSGYGSNATAYGVRAWVNFNGEGTVAIRSSGNVSSITDNTTGNYSVNFTNAMPDTDYAYFGGLGDSTSSYVIRTLSSRQTSASFSTTSHQFACVTDGNTAFDPEAVTIAFIR